MENHGLRTQNDKMCAASLIPQIPHTIYLAHLQKLANYLGCFKKKNSHHSIVHVFWQLFFSVQRVNFRHFDELLQLFLVQ